MFSNRREAGERLSEKLAAYTGSDAIVVGLARGGVGIAEVVSKMLSLSRDVLVVKKISSSHQPELAIGAVAPDNITFVDYQMAASTDTDQRYIKEEIFQKSDLVKQKMELYRRGKPTFDASGKTVIVVDDGAATGATMMAAIQWLKHKHAKKIIVGLPVVPPEIASRLKGEVDELVILDTPGEFSAVGEFYREFPQIEDEEVIQLLS